MKILAAYLMGASALWTCALVSMFAGNDTAASALVGIPIGAIGGGIIIWVIVRPTVRFGGGR